LALLAKPAKPSQPYRYDYEYDRVGNGSQLTEPLSSRCKVSVRTTRMAPDLAQEVTTLLDVDYAEHPPKRSSWLDIAEVELSVFTRQPP